MAISYLLCMERDRLDVYVSWAFGWTIFWDEKHIMTTAHLQFPVDLLVCYISQLGARSEGQERNEVQERQAKSDCHCSPVYFKGQLSASKQWMIKGTFGYDSKEKKANIELYLGKQLHLRMKKNHETTRVSVK